jgi:acetyl-CoA carboxylase carboxyl transferase subunit beta
MAIEKLRKILGLKKKEVPDGLWTKCQECKKMISKKELKDNLRVCVLCEYHYPLTWQERVNHILDKDSFEELWADLEPIDCLGFESEISYKKKIKELQEKHNLKDAAVFGFGRLNSKRIVFGVTDSRFLMGSMGSVVGEKVTRAFELAKDERLPVIIVSGSGGGARMYEGCLSLMQMAKTSSAIARFSDAGGLYISVLTNPTMAGVMASFAGLGDILVAEPKALIGFTGPRVIKQTIKQELPKGFQTAEFMLEHGFVDMVVPRKDLRDSLANLLDYLS